MKNKELFLEIDNHLLQDKMPSEYFNQLFDGSIAVDYPLDMLLKLKFTVQSPKHHPEGSVWNHTMLVVDEAAKVKAESKDGRAFMWAALLHDIGKADTTKITKEKITSYNHDKVGAVLAEKFLKEFTSDFNFINAVVSLIRWHMQILYVVNDLPFARIKQMKNETDINEIALFGLCDRLGRLNADRIKEENNIKLFLQKSNKNKG